MASGGEGERGGGGGGHMVEFTHYAFRFGSGEGEGKEGMFDKRGFARSIAVWPVIREKN